MVNETLTKLLNQGVIKIKRKKTMKKKSNSSKNYKEFLKKKSILKNKNPINKIIKDNIKDIENLNVIDKPIEEKLVTKKKSYDTPKIDIKMPKNISSKTNTEIKKVKVVENVKQPVFSFDRSKKPKKKKYMKKKKKKTKRKTRKITFTVKKTKKNTCDKYKKMKSEVESKKSDDILKELKGKGIKISGKNKKLLKDVYMCADDKLDIKKE